METLHFYRSTREVFKASRDLMMRSLITMKGSSSFAGEDQKGVGARSRKTEHNIHCEVCKRVTYHFHHSDRPICTEHSDWPSKIMRSAHDKMKAGLMVLAVGPDANRDKTAYVPPMKREIDPRVERRLYELSLPDLNPEMFGDDFFGPSVNAKEPSPISGLNCSYCGCALEQRRATEGSGAVISRTVYEVQKVGAETIITEKVKRTVPKVLACPNCCLLPNKIKFPDFD
jgi:hypothetical protein